MRGSLGWLAIVLSTAAAAQPAERFPLVVEPLRVARAPHLSADAGALNLSSVLRAAGRLQDGAIDAVAGDSRLAHAGLRLARFAATDVPLSIFLTWVQHEAFGHDVRCEEQGLGPCVVYVYAPPPYQLPIGDNRVTYDRGAISTFDQLAFFQWGGQEGNVVLASELVRQSVGAGRWDRTASLGYLFGELGQALRVMRGGNNDVTALESAMRDRNRGPMAYRVVSGVGLLLDPTLWYVLYDYFYRWLALGRPAEALPDLLPGSASGWLRPATQLAPWGPEGGLELFALLGGRRYEGGALLGYRRHPTATLWLDASILVSEGYELRARTAAWLQESALPYELSLRTAAALPGIAVEVDGTWWLGERVGPTLRLGGKTAGLWRGRPLGSGLYGHLGVELRL